MYSCLLLAAATPTAAVYAYIFYFFTFFVRTLVAASVLASQAMILQNHFGRRFKDSLVIRINAPNGPYISVQNVVRCMWLLLLLLLLVLGAAGCCWCCTDSRPQRYMLVLVLAGAAAAAAAGYCWVLLLLLLPVSCLSRELCHGRSGHAQLFLVSFSRWRDQAPVSICHLRYLILHCVRFTLAGSPDIRALVRIRARRLSSVICEAWVNVHQVYR